MARAVLRHVAFRLFVVGVLAAAVPHRSLASTLSVSDAGTYGTSFGYLGPRSTRAWENYRKKDDPQVPPWPTVNATDAPPERVIYSNLWQGPQPSAGTYQGPGQLFGTAVSQRSPPNARLYLVQAVQAGARVPIEFRAGFVEHLAAGGGAPLGTFLTRAGGDLGNGMDMFCGFPSGWGIDGLYIDAYLDNAGPTWIFTKIAAHAAAATSVGCNESCRLDHIAYVSVTGASPSGPNWVTAIPSDQPVTLEWRLRPAGGNTYFDLVVGGQVTLAWFIDDGATRRILTTTANADGVPYQNGSIDVNRLVPTIYLGRTNAVGDITGTPETTFELGVSGAVPLVESYPSMVAAGSPFTFAVRARNSADAVDGQYQATVGFSSTDSAASVPAPFQFTASEAGEATFTATFATPGLHRLRVYDSETPALEGVTTDILVFSGPLATVVACDCTQGAGALPLALCAGLVLRSRRARRTSTRLR